MRIKDTLNLGKTKFKMRGNLPVREAEWEKEWEDNHLYEQRLKLNEGHPRFDLHDGPPFANGNIHMGHALNKISKDIIVRYKNMNGYYAPYVPGWDTHGLPVEQQLAKKGIDRKTMDRAKYRELCRQYAEEQVQKQMTDFKRLGVMADWDNPYITLQHEFEGQEIRVFGEMYKKGYIYKGKKPVYWSWSSESTLAEAEVEYKDVEANSIFVAFPVVDGKGIIDPKDTYFVIWTTTPWTIPANEAICVNPKFDYSVVQVGDKKYVVATGLLDKVAEEIGWDDYKVVQTVKGADMEYMKAKHPLYDKESLVTEGFHVTLDDGTGLVHTAPGFGADDFNVGQKYDLPVFSPVDAHGRYTDEVPELEGMFYQDVDKLMVEKLKDAGALLKLKVFTHSYPHDWRTKKPVIFRATTQWFASIAPFRDQILEQIDNAKFIPSWGKTRLYNMIKDRGDWVISRQRAWGVPLPIFYAEDGTPIVTPETIEHIAEIFDKEGSNAWYTHTAKELLPEGFTSEHSPNGEFTKEKDILDVWFDSGSSWSGVMEKRDGLHYPADLYLEGSDQYRGWFNSSLITSVAVTGKAPYKEVLSQGFVLDDKGHKMSKSLGNVISPNDVIKRMGAEIIRLWVAQADTTSDVAVSMGILQQSAESYRKIRNTFRYMLANTSDFDPKENGVAYDDLRSVDQYMEIKLNDLVAECLAAYDKFDFTTVFKKIFNFISNDLSAFYLDFAKDVLYIEGKNSLERRSMQTVIYDAAVKLTKILTPILPHTMEEIWGFLKEPEDYVQLANMPKVENYTNHDELLENWGKFMNLRDDVLKALEDARNKKLIGKSFEAAVTIYPDKETKAMLDDLDADFRQILIVSKLTIVDGEAPENAEKLNNASIVVEHAEGEVCPRCRMIRTDIGEDPKLPELCERCAKIVEEDFPEAAQEGLEE
ncbi:isoleucine--tRNA ligase [Lactobacillus acidophilus]|uniref:isoleucine--tRNA ligase n=1 Tax=Lactobacillus acidophilus TaxID=1579 RepID=UPI000354F3AD|nr:isoleucine--tRNA ligase [Lactobacillus acidophilus]AVW86630.1 isoleucine--tRNA ligase [Lactobacillus acidophilus]KHE30197.1 isoleucine--tRNA ligase [Lactobacillus acidophilus]KRK29520.1 isoleucyl-tRNA synthetase [Lactobacillus acidophilus DSM 20079 = JCM 1132 = NBRC 13951 = CIP 76.13]MBA4557542.1 isoleucine--tRNA ligase [Lactobacillus acidophilus]MBN3462070.1 isoleucine--tRNA ligase [Lactobacillus acidophilus]